MSLFKTAMFVGVVIALLPSDSENQRALRQTALSVSAEARSFCNTRPNICLSREDAWEGIRAKAFFAYTLGSELLWGQRSSYQVSYPAQFNRRSDDDIGTLLQSGRGDL